ncbi:MAG: DUF4404 family protein [Candidatus Sericytochromatia bacterium]
MPTDKLRDSLSELKNEIEHLEVRDQNVKSRIERLIHDLERQLSHPRDAAEVSALNLKLPGLIEQFEVEHPKLTRVLDQIMVSLSNMGI